MRLTILVVAILSHSLVHSQIIDDQVSMGSGYTQQSFYSLIDGEVANVSDVDWDIAFMTDAFNSSILVNDNIGTELFIYSNDVSDWATVDTTGIEWVSLYNADNDWSKGAFVMPALEADPFDYGWGQYNFVTHVVTGNRVFILQTSSGDYKKMIIESLDLGEYTFKYADLDGANEFQEVVNSTDYSDKNFWYYSLADQSVIDREPASTDWDITFRRYVTEIDPIGYYLVSGVQQNIGTRASEARNVNTDDAAWTDFSLEQDINVIGSDWKYFDMDIFQYVIEEDLSYFIEDKDGNIWHLVFNEFVGASTGDISFTKEMVSVTGLDEVASIDFRVFPNPNQGYVTVILPIEMDQAYYTLIDMQGRAVISDTWTSGFEHGLDLYDVPRGIYLLQIEMNGAIGHERLIVR